MPNEHPNIALLKRLDSSDMAGSVDVFSEDVVFHYFNPQLPEVAGDYAGREGVRSFFERIAQRTESFRIEPLSITAVGDELLVVQNTNTLVMDGTRIEVDVVVVWRVVDGRVSEVWDIPAVHTARVSDASLESAGTESP